MGSIGRYLFRTTIGAFLIILVSVTVVIWFTQAMRNFDQISSLLQMAVVFGLWQISRGRAVEPAAMISKLTIAISGRVARMSGWEIMGDLALANVVEELIQRNAAAIVLIHENNPEGSTRGHRYRATASSWGQMRRCAKVSHAILSRATCFPRGSVCQTLLCAE